MEKFSYDCFYKIKIFALCFFFLYNSSNAQYISSTVDQVSSPVIFPGTLNNPVIRVKIEVGPNPITLFALFMTTNGTSNPITNIDSAKVYYTGSSNIFASFSQYGPTATHPNNGFTMNGTFPLSSGTNYFWVVYDINDSAIVCDTIDATCYTVYMSSGTATPVITDPVGNTLIACATALNEHILSNNSSLVFPNPVKSHFTFTTKDFLFATLYSVQGHKILEIRQKVIDVSHLKDGIYFLRVNSENKNYFQTIIVRN